ncbi:MAG: radical SAM protein [Arcobacteraceae bacterium]|nr:radical SAM protein [Arcobacteraceae bacterium]
MSLGVDLSPYQKQCNFDCLYCELAPAQTTDHQDKIVPIDTIITELKTSLLKHKNLDVITLTANGEPTLYPYLDELIDEIDKIKGDVKTLILSNGANINDKNIQNTLSKIDIVKLSLDCANPKGFRKIDRAFGDIDIADIINGMVEFKKIYKGEFVIEVLLVKDVNDKIDDIKALKAALDKIKPDRIDLGTIDRPPAYDVMPISYEKLRQIQNDLGKLPINITARTSQKIKQQFFTKDEIIQTLKMRPLTLLDIENLFDETSQNIFKELVKKGLIIKNTIASVEFYESK